MTEIEFHKDHENWFVNLNVDIICIEPLNGLIDIIATTLITLTKNDNGLNALSVRRNKP